jgi:hypothetical protein
MMGNVNEWRVEERSDGLVLGKNWDEKEEAGGS